jgi:hypothetical protein
MLVQNYAVNFKCLFLDAGNIKLLAPKAHRGEGMNYRAICRVDPTKRPATDLFRNRKVHEQVR